MSCDRILLDDEGPPRRCPRRAEHDVRDRRGRVYSMCREHAVEAMLDGAERDCDCPIPD